MEESGQFDAWAGTNSLQQEISQKDPLKTIEDCLLNAEPFGVNDRYRCGCHSCNKGEQQTLSNGSVHFVENEQTVFGVFTPNNTTTGSPAVSLKKLICSGECLKGLEASLTQCYVAKISIYRSVSFPDRVIENNPTESNVSDEEIDESIEFDEVLEVLSVPGDDYSDQADSVDAPPHPHLNPKIPIEALFTQSTTVSIQGTPPESATAVYGVWNRPEYKRPITSGPHSNRNADRSHVFTAVIEPPDDELAGEEQVQLYSEPTILCDRELPEYSLDEFQWLGEAWENQMVTDNNLCTACLNRLQPWHLHTLRSGLTQ